MNYPLKMNKAMLGAALSLAVALSAGTMFAEGHSAYAATGAVQTKAADNAASSIADKVIATGKQFMGVRYLFGAESDRTDAFDCSSFTQYVFKQNGIPIPRSSRQQAEAGIYVPKSQLRPGDLIFSDTNRDGVINHVSLYMGNGKVLHTYKVGIGVTVSDFEGSTWDKTYVTARRVIPTDASAGNGQSRSDGRSQSDSQSQSDGKSRTDNGASSSTGTADRDRGAKADNGNAYNGGNSGSNNGGNSGSYNGGFGGSFGGGFNFDRSPDKRPSFFFFGR